MQIVCISDTHNYKPILPEGDLLIHAGDATMTGSTPEWRDFRNYFLSQKFKYKIFTPGNHDFNFSPDIALPGVICLINAETIIEGIKFWASPFSPRFGGWCYMRPDLDLVDIWNQIPQNTDIVITHGPPRDILDMNAEAGRCGSNTLKTAIIGIKPKYHIFGHIHESYGILEQNGTTFINASVVNRKYQNINLPITIKTQSSNSNRNSL